MACEGHVVRTKTTAIQDDGFKSDAEAREALLKALMKQVLEDRKKRGENCDKYEDCPKGRRCSTEIIIRTIHSVIDVAIDPYDAGDGRVEYAYDLPALEEVPSKCACRKT